jgi:hypothetical protein
MIYSRQQLQRYMSGMIEPLVRSACLTEPLISEEPTAKVPEAYHPLLAFGRNPARLRSTWISSQNAEICDRSPRLASQHRTGVIVIVGHIQFHSLPVLIPLSQVTEE